MSMFAQQLEEGLLRGRYWSQMSLLERVLCWFGKHTMSEPKQYIYTATNKDGIIDTFSSLIVIRCARCGKPKWVENPFKR